MALSEEQRATVYEVELIRTKARTAAQEEAAKDAEQRSEQRLTSMFVDGGPAGSCVSCGGQLHSRWRFCPFCSHPVESLCLFCGGQLPDKEGVRFCPHCGKKASREPTPWH